ncbi:hypothetical protein L596_000539 [Steinernema carpocapsae]|uniref:Uncharacterized protein n=1 Tax=Steinernema carpocapsae TaxID=34508 RepID=A0A4U8UIQ5_STECR|nr:hypothetical protein L596_000539 [Steinernema carpocapsae]
MSNDGFNPLNELCKIRLQPQVALSENVSTTTGAEDTVNATNAKEIFNNRSGVANVLYYHSGSPSAALAGSDQNYLENPQDAIVLARYQFLLRRTEEMKKKMA